MDQPLVDLVELLTRQKLLLERLLYRAVTLRALTVGGQARFIAWAADELESASSAVAQAELRREMLWAELAARHLLPPEFSFEAVLPLADPVHQHLLTTLRSDLGALVLETRHNLAVIREGAHSGEDAAAEVLTRLRGLDPSTLLAAPGGGTHVDARL